MIFVPLQLAGAVQIDIEPIPDERGWFARTWCDREFAVHGLATRMVQSSISLSHLKGTLRGMHYQAAPFEEDKLVRCTRGAAYDVIIDLRPTSATFRRHVSVVLTEANRRMLYVPKGFAHGFLTLENDTEIVYQMSEYHAPEYASGVRWNDPTFGIRWPAEPSLISERDRAYPDFDASLVCQGE